MIKTASIVLSILTVIPYDEGQVYVEKSSKEDTNGPEWEEYCTKDRNYRATLMENPRPMLTLKASMKMNSLDLSCHIIWRFLT